MNSPASEESQTLLQDYDSSAKQLSSNTQSGIPTPSKQPVVPILLVVVVFFNCIIVVVSLYFQSLTSRALNLRSRDVDVLPRPDPFAGLKT